MSTHYMDNSHRVYPHIEGLRAVAILAVVAHHIGLLPRGFLGVDAFFVISGFLITSLLIQDFAVAGRIRLLTFYARRARRILPLAGLVIVTTLLLVASQGNEVSTQAAAREGVSASIFMANFHYLDLSTDYFSTIEHPVLQNFWSLAVEEQFYLVWPALLLALGLVAKRNWSKWAVVLASVVTVASLAVGLIVGNANPNAAYFMPHTRAYELGIGALLAFLSQNDRLPRLPTLWRTFVCILLLATFLVTTPTYNPALQALPTVLITALVIALGLKDSVIVFESRVLTYIGNRSYGWYLWHWPLLVIFGLSTETPASLTEMFLIVLGAFVLSDLTYRIFENPIRRSAALNNSPNKAISVGLAFALTALSISLIFTQDRSVAASPEPEPTASSSSPSAPEPTPSPTESATESPTASPSSTVATTPAAPADPKVQELVGKLSGTSSAALLAQVQGVIQGAIDAEAFPYKTLPRLGDIVRDRSAWFENGCSVDFPNTDVPECVGGDDTAARTLVLYGDSHATMWMPAFDRIGKAEGWKVVLFAKLACPLVEENVWSYQLNKPFNECQEWQAQVLPRIEALAPEMIVVTDQWKPAVNNGAIDDAGVVALWQRAFQPALARLSTYTDNLVVLGNLPNMSSDPATCLSTRGTDPWICTTLRDDAEFSAVQKIEKNAALAVKAKYVNVMQWACTVQFCPTVIGGRVAYFDQWHFTDTYVEWLEPLLKVSVGL